MQMLCCGAPVQILVCPGRTSGLSPFSVSSWLVTCPGPRQACETRGIYLIHTQPPRSSRSSKPSVWVSFVCRAVGEMGTFTKVMYQWTVPLRPLRGLQESRVATREESKIFLTA